MNTVKEAKEYLRRNFEKGARCPCCGQNVKLYKRKLTSAMAYALILIKKSGHKGFFHVENYLKDQDCPSSIRGDFAKLSLFGLIERHVGKREDGSNRNGHFRITDAGMDFVSGKMSVKSHVHIYNNIVMGFSDTTITIREALGKKFDYQELMRQ